MILYLELIYSLLTTNKVSLLGLLYSIVITILLNFIKKRKVKKVIYGLITIIYLIYFIYFNLMGNHLSIINILNGIDAIEFKSLLLNKMDYLKIIVILLSIVIMHLEIKYLPKNNKILITIGVVSLCLYYSIIFIDNKGIDSSYSLYFKVNNNSEAVKKFGLFTSIKLDVFKKIFDFKESYGRTKYNLGACDNDEVCEISEYLQSKEVIEENKYTGLFAGKNLIIFLAESFYPLGVSEDINPTLYKLTSDGFEFTNYYTPVYMVSTADSQFALDTSLMPSEANWSMPTYTNNYYPYSYPHVLKGYSAYAYHNYDYDYYSRNLYMENMGYTYVGCGNGLEEKMNCNNFQNSDLEMVEATVDDYIKDDKFVVYYTTMSGHANYDNDYAMVKKNYSVVKDLPYSRKVKNYIATQVELDKALEYLIKRLEEENKLEDTVILLSGDHPPYTLSIDNINEVLDVEENFTYYKSNLIIYNSEVEHKKIDKNCSTLDVLPTMLNLFGIDYDTRLLMGTDIFSKNEGIVIFNNRSFIYKDIKYNSVKNTLSKNMGYVELENIKESIYEKYRYSRLILENDYYKILKDFIEK